ncbi:MAG: PQQ-dependent sugar dehydrogenase [Actinomycetota bacterium]|jgi:glucose/arabinose dehydrogenase
MSGTVRRFRAGALALILLALSATMIARSPRAAAATLPAGFTESTIAQVLAPTAMAFAPDGRLFVASQGGPVRVIKDGRLLPTPFVTLNADNQGERGVVGLAFDPQFAQNRWVYITYTAKTPTIHQRVSRFTANGDVAVPGSEQVIFDFDPLRFLNHVAGATHFGPDGKLYVAQGENGIPRFAQQLDNLFGKIIRINKDGSIPTDNPFYNRTTGKNRAIWAYGLRNPFTFAFQPGTGRMFINDVGQDTWEEINEGAPGANYGWPTTEGPTTDARFRAPIFAYRHGTTADTGCSISGGAFYNPASATFPAAYHGAYFFPDFCQGWIKRINPATRQVTHFGGGFGRIVDLKVSADGALWVLGRNGSNRLAPVRRISFAGGSAAPAVTAHPADQTVAVGQEAVFSVSASGSAPLAYQWQRNGANIAGATAPTFRIASATMADHGDRFRVRVSNRAGAVFSNAATLTVLDNAPPVAAITQPTATRYRAGQTFTYAGTGTDPEDGALPASAFTWEVAFHHDDHTHPFVPPTSGSRTGSFTIPTVGETSANVWYRIHLTVRDSAGLTHHVTHDLRPETTTVELRTVPAGLTLTLDGAVATTPFTFTGVEGVVREIGAPSPQAAQGGSWRFASWSDGGPAVHEISTPRDPVTLTATFAEAPGGGISYVASAADGSNAGRKAITIARPAGTVAGDVMLASVVVNDDKPPLSAPAGWRLLRVDGIAASLRQAIFVKTAGPSEPAAYTWTLPDWRRLAGGISTYRGVDLAHRIAAHAGAVDTTADTRVDAPSVAPAVPGTVVVHFAAARSEGTLAPPALMAERWERTAAVANSARDALASSSDGLHPGTGPTGIRSAETSRPSIHIGAVVVLRPAP